MIRRLLRTPLSWLLLAVLGLAAAGGLYWFQPWRLFTDTTVAETLTQVPASTPPGAQASPGPPSAPATATPATSRPAAPAVVGQGSFVTHEHTTTGTARLIRNPDGSHQLELAGLSTSDGPDLRVWLSDQRVGTGSDAWHVFDDGRYLELGRLKGNRGDQVYPVPRSADLTALRSISIWCKRFSVSFGAAALT
ncbi:hypothetical protein Asp14428_07570 [Actinoplanes sp. NBRC 14428]|uniref:Electron transfer DM13 n=1 Tax=Pseudosporangium ferrugineum TaxID=439699 RepID=A0A2T0RKC9_9ACTN|nr:DM13 domain-containing protein [Pseudosporangium ferrugineum]PRY21639.1 electron transfer DM13 [Pseudosporangium ferrugineum]BCJ49282.1 hypothetical protein Asp14428_07570 [Actinoplanes sp. NBRC 14428]